VPRDNPDLVFVDDPLSGLDQPLPTRLDGLRDCRTFAAAMTRLSTVPVRTEPTPSASTATGGSLSFSSPRAAGRPNLSCKREAAESTKEQHSCGGCLGAAGLLLADIRSQAGAVRGTYTREHEGKSCPPSPASRLPPIPRLGAVRSAWATATLARRSRSPSAEFGACVCRWLSARRAAQIRAFGFGRDAVA
jgi:hypothetical protein